MVGSLLKESSAAIVWLKKLLIKKIKIKLCHGMLWMTNGRKSCKKLQPMLREIETPVYLPTHPSLHFKSFASILLHLRED